MITRVSRDRRAWHGCSAWRPLTLCDSQGLPRRQDGCVALRVSDAFHSSENVILDLARADRDPAWPLILAQLLSRQPDLLACDAPLAAAVAAHAAAQALAFIDRPAEAGAVANGTLELVLPSWQRRRRTWPPHPECDCGSRR
jgi:hypothetical protein